MIWTSEADDLAGLLQLGGFKICSYADNIGRFAVYFEVRYAGINKLVVISRNL